jgi:hypothetical protein
MVLALAALLTGVGVGWAAGSTHNSEHSCPASGQCPEPLDASHAFNWGHAVAGGVVAASVVALLGLLIFAAQARAD